MLNFLLLAFTLLHGVVAEPNPIAQIWQRSSQMAQCESSLNEHAQSAKYFERIQKIVKLLH